MYEYLVKLSRRVIENYVKGLPVEKPQNYPKEFERKQGAFCTINSYPSGSLRGCIGVPYPIMPLIDAVIEASKSACNDPRFPPLEERELPNVTIELSILTPPKEIKPSEIVIGRDGLIISHPMGSGLLLPQVPVEYGWTVDEYLKNLCYKAGLGEDCWKHGRLYAFQAKIYKELKPGGKVVEWKIS